MIAIKLDEDLPHDLVDAGAMLLAQSRGQKHASCASLNTLQKPMPTFTQATLTDRDTIAALMHDFYVSQSLTLTPLVLASMDQLLVTPALGLICLIHDNSEIAGYFVLTYGYSLERAGRTALLDELYILPAHRNRNHGTAALHFAITCAKSQACAALHLEVDQKNAAAHSLYSRVGFITHDRHYLTLAL